MESFELSLKFHLRNEKRITVFRDSHNGRVLSQFFETVTTDESSNRGCVLRTSDYSSSYPNTPSYVLKSLISCFSDPEWALSTILPST